jgi:DNA-binding transcriptional MerR regulator
MSASTSHDSSHLSIGEVLNILREEFSDITISKIRFLESQGLIDPERTPSGYRKFYEADVARLRWILHQQKENFLPLKVIKERLEQLGDGEQSGGTGSREQPGTPGLRPRRRPRRAVNPDPNVAPPLPFEGSAGARDEAPPPSVPRPSAPRPSTTPPAPARTPAPAQSPATPRRAAAAFSKSQPATQPAPPPPAPEKAGLTRTELAHAAGLEDWQLAELESFGLLTPIEEADKEAAFDEEDLAIAKACAGFYSHGIGARHLRMYKHFAEREAALFEQVSMHYMRQRNPGARAKAQEELAALSRLGRALRAALLVQAIRDALE